MPIGVIPPQANRCEGEVDNYTKVASPTTDCPKEVAVLAFTRGYDQFAGGENDGRRKKAID